MARYSDSVPRAVIDSYPELKLSPTAFHRIQGMRWWGIEGGNLFFSFSFLYFIFYIYILIQKRAIIGHSWQIESNFSTLLLPTTTLTPWSQTIGVRSTSIIL
jgi:hypothetical protein